MPETPAAQLAWAQNRAARALGLLRMEPTYPAAAEIVLEDMVPALTTLGTRMLRLLEELSEAQVTWYNEKYDHYSCGFCGADQMDIEGEWEHTPDCLISRVRAFLAGTGPEGGRNERSLLA